MAGRVRPVRFLRSRPRPAARHDAAAPQPPPAASGATPTPVAMVHRGVQVTEEQFRSYRPGSTITELGFASTTGALENTFGGNVDVLIASATGRSISLFSRRPEEDEVLFDRGTSFDVLAVGSDALTGRGVVIMREEGSPHSDEAVMATADAFLRARSAVPVEERRALDDERFTRALGADGRGVIGCRPTRRRPSDGGQGAGRADPR